MFVWILSLGGAVYSPSPEVWDCQMQCGSDALRYVKGARCILEFSERHLDWLTLWLVVWWHAGSGQAIIELGDYIRNEWALWSDGSITRLPRWNLLVKIGNQGLKFRAEKGGAARKRGGKGGRKCSLAMLPPGFRGNRIAEYKACGLQLSRNVHLCRVQITAMKACLYDLSYVVRVGCGDRS